MANETPGIEEFNAMNVSAPLPGDHSTFDPPHDTQVPVPEPKATEVPADVLEVAGDPRQIIDDFIQQDETRQKARTFAEKKYAAEQQLAARIAKAEADLRNKEGLVEFANVLESDPEFAQQVGALYQQRFQGAQPSAPAPYSPPSPAQPSAPQGTEEIAALRQQVATMGRTLTKYGALSATQVVQGRHQLSQEDMAHVVATAVAKGYLVPGMDQSQIEERLEDARKIAFFERAKATGKQELLDRVESRQRAVTAQGAAGGAVERKAYDVRGKSFAEIRRDAKLAGERGL